MRPRVSHSATAGPPNATPFFTHGILLVDSSSTESGYSPAHFSYFQNIGKKFETRDSLEWKKKHIQFLDLQWKMNIFSAFDDARGFQPLDSCAVSRVYTTILFKDVKNLHNLCVTWIISAFFAASAKIRQTAVRSLGEILKHDQFLLLNQRIVESGGPLPPPSGATRRRFGAGGENE